MGEDRVAPLVDALFDLRVALRDAVVERVFAEVGTLLDGAPRDELSGGIAQIVSAVLRVFAEESLNPAAVSQLRRTGRRWAELGVDGATQASIVRAACQAAYLFAADLAAERFPRQRDRRPAIEWAGSAVVRAASDIQQCVVTGAAELATRRHGRRGAGSSLVDRMLSSAPEASNAIEDEAAAAGFGKSFGLVLVLPTQEGRMNEAGIQGFAAVLADHHRGLRGNVWDEPIAHVPVLLPLTDGLPWRSVVGSIAERAREAGQRVVTAPEAVGLAKLPLTYRLCRVNLEYSTVLPAMSPLVDLAELQLLSLFSAAREVDRVHAFDMVLAPLLARPELLHVLDALVARGTLGEVEAAIGRPQRTLTRDVRAIKELTGYDWNTHHGRQMLTWGTYLRWHAAVSLGEFRETTWGPMPRISRLGVTR